MYHFLTSQYGFVSDYETDHLGRALGRYYKMKPYIDPLAKCWLEKDGIILAEIQ